MKTNKKHTKQHTHVRNPQHFISGSYAGGLPRQAHLYNAINLVHESWWSFQDSDRLTSGQNTSMQHGAVEGEGR